MAGKFGAIYHRVAACLFIPRPRHLFLTSIPTAPRFLPFPTTRLHPRTLSTLAMAASNGAAATATDSVHEPNPAATDLVHEPPQKISKISPLLKVKKLSDKAVLPSRGSSLAAGYDLSRYTLAPSERKVPKKP